MEDIFRAASTVLMFYGLALELLMIGIIWFNPDSVSPAGVVRSYGLIIIIFLLAWICDRAADELQDDQ